jgi:hypothetical protein
MENWREFVARSSNQYQAPQFYQAKDAASPIIGPSDDAALLHLYKLKYVY